MKIFNNEIRTHGFIHNRFLVLNFRVCGQKQLFCKLFIKSELGIHKIVCKCLGTNLTLKEIIFSNEVYLCLRNTFLICKILKYLKYVMLQIYIICNERCYQLVEKSERVIRTSKVLESLLLKSLMTNTTWFHTSHS